MRSNIVSEAGLPTRLGQWWEGIPFLSSSVVVVCGAIYLACLLVGYDSFAEVCFSPFDVTSHFQVYRIYTAILFHGSLIHVLFNMMALVPLGSELERIMGSVRFLYLIILLATTNAIFHLFIALVVAHNPLYSNEYLLNECAIGFSGVLFSMIVIETSLSGAQHRSVFGLFNIPAKWYPWILLAIFQLLMTNVSFLGHLCGILSGFAYTYGLFNFIIPGPSFYSNIESFSWISSCVRRPKFIVSTGASPSGYLPTYSNPNDTQSDILSGNIWRNITSLIPQRETTVQSEENDGRFPGRGRTLGAPQNQAVNPVSSDSSLQARLLDSSNSDHPSHTVETEVNGRQFADNINATTRTPQQAPVLSNNDVQKLVAMGFDKTQVEVAVAAADGDLNVAIEILMTQQPQ
ncbi:rhomboid-like protein 15 isoform X2 [Impatiens glandulifera]|uniref:rhomboid-like protein 15 isoform X2 n=1 Tax=Impatiens glandulifera TaxID=253017 RepID=UPI001FB191D8|nr:rhomboid-like protein 15 isoform X2 [Impatiens glandulifera]